MSKYELIQGADTEHEDAIDWYQSYGAHIETEHHGCIEPMVVGYADLDGNDVDIRSDLLRHYPNLLKKARAIREAADGVEAALEAAVSAYEAGDVDGVIEALDEASSIEREHGDDPASSWLREKLVREIDED